MKFQESKLTLTMKSHNKPTHDIITPILMSDETNVYNIHHYFTVKHICIDMKENN